MIQLPSKIRTTLFNATVEAEPYQLFSHEDDRLLVLIYLGEDIVPSPAFGRSGQDVLNSDTLSLLFSSPVYFYGPEPLWMGSTSRVVVNSLGLVLVHAVYRV